MSAQTLNLFADLVADAPETEGIKYAGSKLKLLPHILQLVQKVKPRTVLDGFSGTRALPKCWRKPAIALSPMTFPRGRKFSELATCSTHTHRSTTSH